MVIILVRRFVRPDREQQFLEAYRRQSPNDDPAFHGETLTRLNDGNELPADMKSLSLRLPGSLVYMNVARWDSWNACRDYFARLGVEFDPDIETKPAEQAVLDLVQSAVSGSHECSN